MKFLPKILLALTAVAAVSVAYPTKANLINNPGFETGDFRGYAFFGFGFVTGTISGVPPHSGNFQATLGNAGIGFLSPAFATTPGASYTIDFYLASTNRLAVDTFSLSWQGVPILSLTGQTPFGYTHYTFTETASTASFTALMFRGACFDGHWLLDDVSVELATVPDGGTTVSLLGCALLGLAGLRRRLGC
ncbi:MAG TPA: VPDSG-CTERM sorting domain-containing protein [Candidatus Udaeobacter sp.]|jgi:hypothetical protein